MRRVEVGFFSFTEVPAGAHRAYNEWHQLDHLPEQYQLEGIVHGERWVATPACLPHRLGTDDALGRAQYLTLYLMTAPVAETLDAFRALAVQLRSKDRFFEQREAHLTGALAVVARSVAPRVLVGAEVIPWRPNTGIYAVVEPAGAPALDPDDLVALDGVAGAWSFDDSASYRITVAWLDGDPIAVAAAAAPLVSGRDVVTAGPYLRVDPWQWNWWP